MGGYGRWGEQPAGSSRGATFGSKPAPTIPKPPSRTHLPRGQGKGNEESSVQRKGRVSRFHTVLTDISAHICNFHGRGKVAENGEEMIWAAKSVIEMKPCLRIRRWKCVNLRSIFNGKWKYSKTLREEILKYGKWINSRVFGRTWEVPGASWGAAWGIEALILSSAFVNFLKSIKNIKIKFRNFTEFFSRIRNCDTPA